MTSYKLIPTKSFLKDLKKIDSQFKHRMENALLNLQENPFQWKRLSTIDTGKWRIRVGDYRIRYDIMKNDIVLHRVRHRKDIYRS